MNRGEHIGLAHATRDNWKRVSSKLWPQKRTGGHLRESGLFGDETANEEGQLKREREERELLKIEEKEEKTREEKEEQERLEREAREAEMAEKARIEAKKGETTKEAEASSGGSLHIPSNSLPLDVQLAAIPKYKQVLESTDTASIEQEENLVSSSILIPFENADPAGSLLDNMRAMLDTKARTGGKVFPNTQLKDPEDNHEGFSMNKKNKRDNEDDNASVISSYAASIFSVQSAASSATDLAKGSGYSVDEITTATEDLLAILQNNVDLAPLYLTAIEDPSIGPQRLQRNLRRIFKQYAEHLKKEAKDRLEFLTSQLVSLKAGFLSQSIVECCTRIAAKTEHEKPHKVGMEENFDDEWEEDNEAEEEEEAMHMDDTNFEDLIAFREFLLTSSAFQTLRSQIQNFVLPNPSRATGQEIVIREDEKGALLEVGGPERRGVKTARILRHIMRRFNTVLIATGYLEPPLEPAMVRLRWKCVSLFNASISSSKHIRSDHQ